MAAAAAVTAMQIDPLLTGRGSSWQGLRLMAAQPRLTPPQTEPEKMPWMTEDRPCMPALLKKTEEAERYQRRLRYLARRIARDRAPFCPLNGLLLLLPFACNRKTWMPVQLASVCQSRSASPYDGAKRITCPVIVLVTDLETAPGYPALRASLDADRRTRLFGQELPLLPDLKTEELPRMLSGSLRHFTHALSQWVFRLFRVEKSGLESSAACSAGNGQLFELLEAIRRREEALGERVLARVLVADPPLEFLLGGFYFAATGGNAEQDQAFPRRASSSNLCKIKTLSHGPEDAATEERNPGTGGWTTYGYAALAIFCIAVVVIIYGRWQMLHWH